MYRFDLIRAAVVNKNLNKSSFSKESGIASNTVKRLWLGEVNIELPSLIKASEFLDIPMQKLFEPKQEAETASGK
jgi:transcriptional regulator with XRE-family HTH domain